MKRFPALLVLFTLAGCELLGDSNEPYEPFEPTYRTELGEGAAGAVQLPDGGFIAYGSAEGRVAPTDGTLAYPLLLQLKPDLSLVQPIIYRDKGFGSVVGVEPLDNGLAVLVREKGTDWDLSGGPDLTLYRTDEGGVQEGIIFQIQDATAPNHGLLRTSDGGFLLTLHRRQEQADDLIKIDAAGAVKWTYDMSDVQFVTSVAQLSGGDIIVLGVRDSYYYDLARLGPDGQSRWLRTYGDGTVSRNMMRVVAVGDGIALLQNRDVPGEANMRSVVATRFDAAGDVLWEEEYALGNVWATAITSLADGGLAIGWSKQYDEEFFGARRAAVMRLAPNGDVRWRRAFGPRQGTTQVSHILQLQDGRLVGIGSTGPEQLSGYGGDDFDVLVDFLGNE